MPATTVRPSFVSVDPSAFSQPEVLRDISISESLSHILGAIWLGDLANALYDEYIMLSKHNTKFPDLVYFSARLACLGFVISDLVLTTSVNFPVDCQQVSAAVDWFASLTVCLTSLLFFFRIKAVFHDFPIVVVGFFLLWMGTWTSLVGPLLVHAIRIGSTHCVISDFSLLDSIPFIAVAIHDTMVFLAISIRLTLLGACTIVQDGLSLWKAFLALHRSDMSGTISKALLKTGQLYYLVTFGVSVGVAASLMVSSIPVAYRSMFIIVDILLQNSMACRVYRQLKIGQIVEVDITNQITIRNDRRDGLPANSAIVFERNSGLATTLASASVQRTPASDTITRSPREATFDDRSLQLNSCKITVMVGDDFTKPATEP
ncbi:hypothetical protein C8Q75DRAFT_806695 [Abortiporus biennis]|nr:hypothetical protein C8Q75DRAFT_806695 [Abortiporus biennis]